MLHELFITHCNNTVRHWTSAHAVKQTQTKLLQTSGMKNLAKLSSACKWSYETLSSSPSLVQNTRKVNTVK